MIKSLATVLLLVVFVSAERIPTLECPNITANTKEVYMEVTDCLPSHERCPLYQGKSHNVKFEFALKKNYTGKIEFRVFGVFEKFTVPYKGKTDGYDNANYMDTQEPLKDVGMFVSDRMIRHNSEFAVSSNYPKIDLRVRFMLQTKRSKEVLLCVEIPVGIKSNPVTEAIES